MPKQCRLVGVVLLSIVLTAFAPPRQALSEVISLAVNPGFDSYFRENEWLPLHIRVSNNGDDIEGALVVRPETSGSAFANTYSVPINLPNGSQQAVFLYTTARSFASQVRVELISNDGLVLAAEPVNLRGIQPRDRLYAVVSSSAVGSVDLTGVRGGGFNAYQANWQIENIPDRAPALTSLDMILFSDVDTGALSTQQKQAVTDWVAQGGHLIVTGGSNWQATAAGFTDLLPVQPSDSTTLPDLNPLVEWARFRDADLSREAIVSTGVVKTDAQVLVSSEDNLPLIVRGNFGAGTVDYMSVDPNTQPLRGWGGLTDMWFALATSVDPKPSWNYGIQKWEQAASATSIMPGVDLLPDILPLCGFLAAYIALIGPLNYIVLNRFNRREFAWVTIPMFIILFSALAWTIGFNLRGSDVTLSRLAVVQSWPDVNRAQVEELVGLLSPRRATYDLGVEGDTFLRPIPRLGQTSSSLLSANLQVNADIQQTDQFLAAGFPVDASFIASFDATSVIERPAIDGEARLFYDQGLQVLRGSVRNDTNIPLSNSVILARGTAFRLEDTLQPGAVATFDITLPGIGAPSPSPLSFVPGGFTTVFGLRSSFQNQVDRSVLDLVGGDGSNVRQYQYYQYSGDTAEEQEDFRRRLFAASFVSDPYDATGRANRVFLAGWSDRAPLDISLTDANWRSVDTTLYLAELTVEVDQPAGRVRITPDQFTWAVREGTTLDETSPMSISLQQGDETVFRFTPQEDAVLSRVDELIINVQRGNTGIRNIPLHLWDWERGEWESIEVATDTGLVISRPQAYLGPRNAVEIRIVGEDLGSFSRIQSLLVEQEGTY